MTATYKDELKARRKKYGIEHMSESAMRAIDAERIATQRRMDEAAAARRAALEHDLKTRFIDGGGNEAEWAREGPAILAAARAQAALTGDAGARAANARRYG